MRPGSALARLQRLAVLVVLALAVGWLSWQWHASSTRAVLGAIGIALTHVWVLAIEFVLFAVVSRGDATPKARPSELLRAWLGESWHGLKVFAWRQPFRWQAVPDHLSGSSVSGRHGVVFIHGFVCNRGFWAPWMRLVAGEGRACVAVNLEPVFGSIDDYLHLIDTAATRVRNATGLPPVLVCHSMGGLVARAWLRERGVDAAASVITIGTPHRGTWLARFSHLTNGRQMRIDGPWMQVLLTAWDQPRVGWFTCWYSNTDNIVFPPSTATLPGADNRLVRGAGHVQLAFTPEVMQGTLALLRALPDQPTAADASK